MTSALPAISFFTIFIFILIGIAVLQGIICAKAKNKLLGLIIPIIAFLGGLFISLVVMYAPSQTSEFIRQLLICQIPTLVYLAIFAIVRLIVKAPSGKPSDSEIQKMNIQDL